MENSVFRVDAPRSLLVIPTAPRGRVLGRILANSAMDLVLIAREYVIPKAWCVIEIQRLSKARKESQQARFEGQRIPEQLGIIEHKHAPTSSKQISVRVDELTNRPQMIMITTLFQQMRGERPEAQRAPHEHVDWPQPADAGVDHLSR